MKLKRMDSTGAAPRRSRGRDLRELVEADTARRFATGDATRLRKWGALPGDVSPWRVTTGQIVAGPDAMLSRGYTVSAANRDLSAIGSAYKFAQDRRITPRGFVSPTRAIRPGAEPIRRVMVSDDERAALV